LRGWADANQDGVVRVRELIDYTQKSIQHVQLPNLRQEPFWIGSNDIILGQTLENRGPDLNLIRESLDPIVESKMGWEIAVRTGSGKSLDYDQLVSQVEAQAEARAEQRKKEELRQGILESKARELQLKASNIWKRMRKARRIGGKEVYALVEHFIKDFGDLTVEVDGATKRVEISEVDVAKRWLRDKGRKLEGVLGYDMQLVTVSPFIMGSPQAERDRQSDEVLHEVLLTQDYFLGTYEVSQRIWTSIMGSNPSHFQRCGEDCPIESVSWCDTIIFANRISEREGFAKVYSLPYEFEEGMAEDQCGELSRMVMFDHSKNGYRLPTEAEWEYAAQAGRDSLYSGSGDPNAVGWTLENSSIRLHTVGILRPNDWGFYDMSGNVWEYIWDWYAPYPEDSVLNYNYSGPKDGILRGIRGGSWGMSPDTARVSNRHYATPGYRIRDVGFRLARSAF
jgi:formylglycine-generating enzyme required for sulfatase activity